MNCKICTSENKVIFSSKILNKYIIDYFHCKNCGFLLNKIYLTKCFRVILKYRIQKKLIEFVKFSMKSKTMDDMYWLIEKMEIK